MSNRFKNALQAQQGASNQRLLARILSEAINDVGAEGGFISDDPAVYLITHQLVWVLYSTDITLKHGQRWNEATKACEDKVAEQANQAAFEAITTRIQSQGEQS